MLCHACIAVCSGSFRISGVIIMLKPLRRCAYPGCRMLVPGRYCPAHEPQYQRGDSDAWHYLYTDPRYGWRKRRAEQLAKEPFCRTCAAKGLRVRATEVDHIVPHKGSVELFLHGELQSLCHRCHSRKTAAENGGKFGGR